MVAYIHEEKELTKFDVRGIFRNPQISKTEVFARTVNS